MSELFQPVALFAELSEDQVRDLQAACEERFFKAGDRIIVEGMPGEGLFIVVEGTASVLKFSTSKNEIELGRLHAGEHFGEMSLVSDKPTSASVRAESDMKCLFISRGRFDGILRDKPDIARKILTAFVKTLSHRLADIDVHYATILRKARRREAVRHVVNLSWLQWRMLLSYGWMWSRSTLLRWKYSPQRLSVIHRGHAQRFKVLASQLKGATVKIAQLASLQQHLLPPEYIEEFKTLRDQVAPSEFALIAGTIQAELGAGPTDIFASFDRIPLAAASMGQVHRARLRTGEEVVVKILHPGVDRSVLIDLWITKVTLIIMNAFMGKIDLMQIYKESEEPLLKELDLIHEARATEQLGEALRPLDVGTPKVYRQYSTRRILTLGFVEGINLDKIEQMKAWNIDRVALAQTYLRAFLHQALTGGFFHADPHPANCLCTSEGKLVLLDFGMVKQLPDHVRRGITKEWMGFFFNNSRMHADGVIEKGAIQEEDRAFLEQTSARVFANEKFRNLALNHEVDGNVLQELSNEFFSMLRQLKTFKTPQNEVMFLRGFGIAIDTVKELVPEMKMSDVAMPVYLEVFQRLIRENPQYSAGPFRVSVSDMDATRYVAPLLAQQGVRNLTLKFEPRIIRARGEYSVNSLGIGDVSVGLALQVTGIDTEAQIISVRIVDMHVKECGEPGLFGQLLGATMTAAKGLSAVQLLDRGLKLFNGRLPWLDGAEVGVDVRLKVSAFASLAKPYIADLRLDDLSVEDGRIVIGAR